MFIADTTYYCLVFLVFTLGRYFLAAGTVFWLFHSPSSPIFFNPARPGSSRRSLIHHDIALSVSSAVIFALLAALMMIAYQAGYTRLYSTIDDYGWWYLGLSFAVALLLQDGYFYVTHRLLHHPRWYRRMHRGHHYSRTPTPWTSFAFDPYEALIHGIFFVGLVFTIPLHIITLGMMFMTMTLWSVTTHLGRELIPPQFPLLWLRQGLIGSAHHQIHHRQHGVHFGLYFTFWDRVFGTVDSAYLERYGRPPKSLS